MNEKFQIEILQIRKAKEEIDGRRILVTSLGMSFVTRSCDVSVSLF